MLQALTLILICQLAGELVVRVAGLPVPGPVLGMLLLLGWLFLRDGISPEMERTTTALLDHLSLLFVPAGMKHCPLILKRVDRPIFHFTTVPGGQYVKDENKNDLKN